MTQRKQRETAFRLAALNFCSLPRAVAKLMLVLVCIGGVVVGLGAAGVAPPARAQTPPNGRTPSEDVAPMSPGQRVQTRWGFVQITTFSRSPSEAGSTYRIDFVIDNARPEPMRLFLVDFIRLITDGLPRAPIEVCTSKVGIITQDPRVFPEHFTLSLSPGSAEDCFAIFRVPGQVHDVLIQFATGQTGVYGYLRWPE